MENLSISRTWLLFLNFFFIFLAALSTFLFNFLVEEPALHSLLKSSSLLQHKSLKGTSGWIFLAQKNFFCYKYMWYLKKGRFLPCRWYMKKLIRQIRSFGSQRGMSVCMLPRRQKPEDIFMAPTYIIGGSDSSCTRQGGFNFIAGLLMVLVLLVRKVKDKQNNAQRPVLKGYSIKTDNNFLLNRLVFSTPKVLRP